MGLAVFNYHQIYSGSADEIRISGKFGIDENDFKSHIDFLDDYLTKTNHSNQKSILLTFDDGFKSHLKIVVPYIESKNLEAIFFPIVEKIGQPEFMTWEDLRELSQRGFKIGAHGKTHLDLTNVSSETLLKEISESKAMLEQELTIIIDDFSLPYGKFNKQVLEALKIAGYKKIYTTQGILNDSANELVHRMNIKSGTSAIDLSKKMKGIGLEIFIRKCFFWIKSKSL